MRPAACTPFNGDPNVAKLQKYTIDLYREIEAISGQSCGIHRRRPYAGGHDTERSTS